MQNDNMKELRSPETCIACGADGVPVIKFKAFESMDWLSHGFSTRMGGVSAGTFKSMNLSFSRGDDSELVMENFRRFGNAININYKDMIFTHQTHTTNIRVATAEDKGKGIVRARDYSDIDGLITNEPGLALVTFFADCVPLYFADPVTRTIGASHSGWRGTVARMGQVTVQAMCDTYGCKPENMTAVIGPSICRKCYEVSEDVAKAFAGNFPGHEWQDFIDVKDNGKYQLDLWRANWYILKAAGIPEANIHVSGLCTHCHPNVLWSHRSLGDARGSLAGFMMKEN